VKRGEVWWANLPEPVASEPGYRRPVLIISSNFYNLTSISTIIGITLTSNLDYARLPNNIFLSSRETGLSQDSVINMTQVITVDKRFLEQQIGNINQSTLEQLNESLKTVLDIY
jgi:mRNA interferase MazF